MTSAEVTWQTAEEAPQRLLYEWLSGYFDGGSHEVGPSGTGAVLFPKASISFDQAELPQPLDGSGVSGLNILVIGQTIDTVTFMDGDGKFMRSEVRLDFFVRAGVAAFGQGNPQYVCRKAAQLLRACLTNDHALQPLAQKGIYDLYVKEAEPIISTFYQLRRIRGRCRFEYNIPTR